MKAFRRHQKRIPGHRQEEIVHHLDRPDPGADGRIMFVPVMLMKMGKGEKKIQVADYAGSSMKNSC